MCAFNTCMYVFVMLINECLEAPQARGEKEKWYNKIDQQKIISW